MSEQRIKIMKQCLQKALTPDFLKIIDESHLHQGHAGAATGRGHFYLEISSPLFANKGALQCHRLIYQALGNLMETDIHALRIKIIHL